MKKHFKYYMLFWAVLLILFNVIAFVFGGWGDVEQYTSSFWIGYVSIVLCFIGQLVCTATVIGADSETKTFYNITLITTSYSGLFSSFVAGGICMIFSFIPYWVSIILCSVILVLNIISVIKAKVLVSEIERIDEKIRIQTEYIKTLTVSAENLMNTAQNNVIKKECFKVYEAIRYSDKMSNSSTQSIEEQISYKFSEFSDAVFSENQSIVKALAEELLVLISERNNECMLTKQRG